MRDIGEETYRKAEAEVEARSARLWEVALRLHADPEPAYAEHRSARLLADELAAGGFTVAMGVAGMPTAFVARSGGPGGPGATGTGSEADPAGSGSGGDARPRVALLMEYDALPELGHACGHNLIAAGGLGAALAVRAVAGPGARVAAVGSPAEESGGGKVAEVAAGVFDGMDAALMVHPGVRDQVWAPLTAQVQVRARFHGRAAHPTGNPTEGVDALAALLRTFDLVGAVARRHPAGSHVQGIVTEGGRATNIVPDLAEGLFGCRGLTTAALDDVVADVTRCARAAADAVGATVEVERVGTGYQHFRNSVPLSARFAEHIARSGVRLTEPEPGTFLGSSDIGDVSGRVPAIHPFVAITGPDGSDHTPRFAAAAASARGRDAMIASAKALACLALDVLYRPELRERSWQSFHAQAAAGR